MRIGILGGTFDPIHIGHLALAEEARWALDLEHVYLVPAAQQPLKQNGHAATPQQRLAMVQLACQGNPHLHASDLELQRPPPSYTVETLEQFRATLGSSAELWFLIGGDALNDFPRWYQAERIIALARLAVVMRPGTVINTHGLEERLPGLSERLTTIEGPQLEIASSALRQRMALGQPVRYQIPDAVLEYIRQHGLYGIHDE
ncbi:MAG: nicotinate-nucleotide adenylyltransferase [Chloroflexaceae bacterium]|jgi:nicotinate-nucleotide adenylyltransferase|nr:nicotinate-nucleotide adenylyltransferase [Chloroflexaceae bacterium]